MQRFSLTLAAVIGFGLAAQAGAEGLAVTPNLGAPHGFGLDLTLRASKHVNLRVGGGIPQNADAEDMEIGDVKYDIKLKIGGVNAFVDWHPTGGRLRLGAGAVSVRSPWTFKNSSKTTFFAINGQSYAVRDVGTLSGEIRHARKLAPALLVGWGNAVQEGRRWGFSADLGVIFAGRRDFTLNASGPIATNPAFQRDLEAERRKHSADEGLLPLFKIGISYQF